jgi:hypothetical protein
MIVIRMKLTPISGALTFRPSAIEEPTDWWLP